VTEVGDRPGPASFEPDDPGTAPQDTGRLPPPSSARWRSRLRGVRPGLGAAGVVLIGAGLLVPWLGVPLEPERRAFALRLYAAGMPVRGWASYGGAELVFPALAIIALLRSRGGRSWLAGAAGLLAVLLPVLFVVQTALSDAPLAQHLNQQQNESTSISHLFSYAVPRSSVTSVLLFPLTGNWRLVASELRSGWFLCVGGGIVLFARHFPAMVEQLRRRRSLRWGSVATLLVVAGLIGRGIAANLVTASATDALVAGDYATAISRLDFAERLNPDLRYRLDVELTRGQALEAGGDRSSPLALLYLSRVRHGEGDNLGALAALQAAAREAPSEPVITAEYIRLARTLAVEQQDPGPLQAVVAHPYGDLAAEHYALGRILLAQSDFGRAIPQMQRTIALSSADANVRSSAYTYLAICELRLGHSEAGHRDLLTAVALDGEYINSLARSLAAGFYVAGPI